MADIELLLRDYGQRLDERCPEISVAELQRHLELTATDEQRGDDLTVDYLRQPHESTAPAAQRRWIGVVTAVAAAILVVVGVVVVADGNSDDVVTNPVSSPSVADSFPSFAWSRVPRDAAVFGGEGAMRSVTVGGPGLVAVGWDESDVADWDAGV